jgi:hypothetical protein
MTAITCHITGTEERPTLGSRGLRARNSIKRISPRLYPFLEPTDNPGNAGCLNPRDSAGRISGQAVSPYKKDTL